MKFLKWLDKIQFLNIKIWNFGFRSMFHEYGIEFFIKVALRYPIKTLIGINKYRKLILQNDLPEQIGADKILSEKWSGGNECIIGVGFCLKPLNPVCISERANHNCFFFENNLHLGNDKIPGCCKICSIREIGLLTLLTGSSFYIMTSAEDIMFDMFLPALQNKKFSKALIGLCRYSFEPFKIALLISGINAYLFPYESGDCKDYNSWLQADIGIKNEQTKFCNKNLNSIKEILTSSLKEKTLGYKFKKIGNIFYKN